MKYNRFEPRLSKAIRLLNQSHNTRKDMKMSNFKSPFDAFTEDDSFTFERSEPIELDENEKFFGMFKGIETIETDEPFDLVMFKDENGKKRSIGSAMIRKIFSDVKPNSLAQIIFTGFGKAKKKNYSAPRLYDVKIIEPSDKRYKGLVEQFFPADDVPF